MRGAPLLVLALLASGCAPRGAAGRLPRRETVRFWHPWGGDDERTVKAICERFNRSQARYEVVPLGIPGGPSASTKFMLAVSGGDPPDLVATWDAVLPLWARDGVVQPLDARMSAADARAYAAQYAVARKAGAYRGRVYGLAVGLNVQGVYYRPSVLRAAGLPARAPRTLEEIALWGDRLVRRNRDGSLQRLGLLVGSLRDTAPLFGGGYERGRIDTPENRAALRWLADSRRRVGFDDYVRFQVGLGLDSAGGSSGAGWPFVGGRYALAVDGQWKVAEVAGAAPEVAREYRTAPLPPRAAGPQGAGFAVATLLAIPAGARRAEGAYAFARYWGGLADPALAAELNASGGWLPSGPAMAAAPAYRAYVRRYPQFRAFMDEVARPAMQTYPPVPDQAFLMDVAGKAEWRAISGEIPPDAALREAQRDLEKERARRRALGERL